MADIIPFAGEFSASPADPTPLLALARAQLSWRGFFKADSPEEQDAAVQQQARGLAIAASDIGKSAVRIGTALELLLDEVRGFLERWPDKDAASAATLAAITGAGLLPGPDDLCTNYKPEHFEYITTELRIWEPVLDVIQGRLETCEKIDTAASLEEWEELQRRAA